MNVSHPNQLDLLSAQMQSGVQSPAKVRLVVALDHRRWMRFLSEEWLMPDEAGWIYGGIDGTSWEPSDPDLTTVTVWFDLEKLPALEVMLWGADTWHARKLDEVQDSGIAVLWPGPLPLFAVNKFTVESAQTRAHLLSMVRNFADMELPAQPVEIGETKRGTAPPEITYPQQAVAAPGDWNKLRGAASMAMVTVPTIGPWLQILCDSLSRATASPEVLAAQAPWLGLPLWSREESTSDLSSPLWCAMCGEFSRPEMLNNWVPEVILDEVCARARALGESDDLLDRLVDSTMLLLRDRGTIEDLGISDNLVALTFQLLLLRPSPARFVSWKEDWRAIPPGAWWTGAIVAGYLSGYRGLPLELRGSELSRREVSLRTWKLKCASSFSPWESMCDSEMRWHATSDSVLIYAGTNVLAEPRISARGQWYDADFNADDVLSQAAGLARDYCPLNVRQTLTLNAGDFKLRTSGKIKFDSKNSTLTVSKQLEIPIGDGAFISEKLDIDGFRSWLTTASMPFRLPRPPARVPTRGQPSPAPSGANVGKVPSTKIKSASISKKTENSSTPPLGLSIVENFITDESERYLLDAIDDLPWNTTMARRVQHHGWRYDYKAKKVDPASYLGPLPDWASELAERLLMAGYVPEMPDQVIVNEYVGMQGISKHIDCPSCFRGPVVTISLGETWEMVFSREEQSGQQEKYRVMLPRRSAVVLDGESRSLWSHEIAKKKTDDGRQRNRRVSITFRKVASQR
ncbi:hypothetical protein GEV02_17545 [Rugamonas sp. FT29W]|uniref:Fe2OG dioxygenase domain-containing protein n=2 Tax=Rugamonas aquatica TaxID=2743357 RepID=A0A6A7N503_9BURK|nr:hypothetical protein [Rugamonas aquatica]